MTPALTGRVLHRRNSIRTLLSCRLQLRSDAAGGSAGATPVPCSVFFLSEC